MRVLGVNAIYHEPAAAVVVDGEFVAAAVEQRFPRRVHGPARTPERAARQCLREAGLVPEDIDAVAVSFDPALCRGGDYLAAALPGLDETRVHFVPHHVAHAASAAFSAPFEDGCAVLVLDGRGEQHSHLAAWVRDGSVTPLHAQRLPESLGLLYEEAADHLGVLRTGDGPTIATLAARGTPRHLNRLREFVHATGNGGFVSTGIDWNALTERRMPHHRWTSPHLDLAASLQRVVEETVADLATWLQDQTGSSRLALAGDAASTWLGDGRRLAGSRFERIWVQPAAGDGGTALGAALAVAAAAGEQVRAMTRAAPAPAFATLSTD